MRHIKPSESTVMQEFERIAAERGWASQPNIRTAQEPAVPEHIPTGLAKKPHEVPADIEAPTTMRDIDKMLEGVKESEPQDILVGGVQKALQRTLGGDVLGPKGPDGMWGWFTSKAWNEFAKRHPEAGLPQTTEKQRPNDAMLMRMLEASKASGEKMPEVPIPFHLVKEPHMTQPWQYSKGPELVPKSSLETINELVALANDLDEMSEAKVAEAVDEQLRLYKAAVDKLYDVTGETGEQLVGKAHPGGGPTMAPAKEEGGKVETIVEEQKRNLKVVKTQPTGKQAAFVARQLVALANRLDMEGKTEAALLVDKTLAELREGSPRPFVGTSKTAATGIMEAIQNFIDTIDGVDVQYKNVLAGIRKTLLTAKNDIYNARQAQAKAPSQRLKDGWAVTEARKIIELDSESDSWWPMIEEAMSWSWASVALIGDKPKLGRAIRTLKSAIVQEKSANQDLFHQAEAQLEAAAPQPPAPGGRPGGGTPTPQAGRSEQPKGAPAATDKENKAAHDNFIGTVNKLIKALTNPAKMGEIQKLFGGEEKLDKQLEWLMKLRQTKPPTNELERLRLNRSNNKIWNYYMKALQARKLAAAKVAAPPAKPAKAAPAVPEGGQPLVTAPPVAPAPGKGTVAPRRTKGVVKRPRENLRQLQSAMLAAGIPLPSHQADGKWGPETWRAWNSLRDAIIERRGPGWDIGRPPTPAGNGPGDNAINAALNMAKHLGRLQSARATVNIAPGIQVPERSLADAQAFIKALSARPNSGVSPKGTPREQAAAALKLAQAYALALEQEDSDESWSLAREGVDRNARAALVGSLVGQLKALETGIPSYRRPGGARRPGYGERSPYGRGEGEGEAGYGGRSPYGRGKGGAGPFGTLEGGPGGYGGRGGGGGGTRPEPEMSVTDQVYTLTGENIPVNDAQQALFWAYDFWRRHYKEMAAEDLQLTRTQRANYYLVADKVIRFLRIRIAQLGGTAEVRRNSDLQIELRRLYEDVTAMQQLLRRR